MVDRAVSNVEVLRKALTVREPKPVRAENTFDAQFDPAVRNPARQPAIEELGRALDILAGKGGRSDGPTNGTTFVIPVNAAIDRPDDLEVERQVWNDRLEVMQRGTAAPEKTLHAHIEKFLTAKQAAFTAGG